MANVSEDLVREFLELNEFTVKIHRKHTLMGSRRDALDEIGMIAANSNSVTEPAKGLLLGRPDIGHVDRAVVGVRGWHSETFSPSRLKSSPEIFNLAQLDEKKIREKFFQGESFKRVLVIPSLPSDANTRREALQIFVDKGIDHILEFKVIIEDLIDRVQVQRNYAESSTLQLIRILKCYDLLRDPQLELF